MRLALRVKIKNLTFFSMLSHTQTLQGIGSRLSYTVGGADKDTHIILLDLDKCTETQMKKELLRVQKKYKLAEMHILTDKPQSYRVFCFTPVTFKTLIKIMLDCNYIDWNFVYWTMQKSEATLRLTPKKDRSQTILTTIKGEILPVPDKLKRVRYDTGHEKEGVLLTIRR